MMLFIVIAAIVLILMFVPLAVGKYSLDKNKKVSLVVRNDNVKDPRYFAKSFLSLMDRALEKYDGSGIIQLSKEEKLIEPAAGLFAPKGECEELIHAKNDFRAAEKSVFLKEIYAKKDAVFERNSVLRAVATRGKLKLQEGVEVERWADAGRTFQVEAGCDLGISATSEENLYLAPNCQFHRLFAAKIEVVSSSGTAEVEPIKWLFPDQKVFPDILWNAREVDDNQELENTIVTKHNLVIGEHAVVKGDIKSEKNIHIKANSQVMGNVFADGDVVFEENVCINGHVFSQSHIFIGPDNSVGRPGAVHSVVARETIVLCETAKIYGYVGAEGAGETVSKERYLDILNEQF